MKRSDSREMIAALNAQMPGLPERVSWEVTKGWRGLNLGTPKFCLNVPGLGLFLIVLDAMKHYRAYSPGEVTNEHGPTPESALANLMGTEVRKARLVLKMASGSDDFGIGLSSVCPHCHATVTVTRVKAPCPACGKMEE